jgi:hypothetical protein
VSLGDERFRSELDNIKAHLSPSDVQAAARCESGFPTDAQVRFWLDWAEELMPLADDPDAVSKIGSVAGALGRIRVRALNPYGFSIRATFSSVSAWPCDQNSRILEPRRVCGADRTVAVH